MKNYLNQLLASEKIIRVYPDVMPGSGDQAACISMMDWLRLKGFQGVFEVIYCSENQQKMISLFNLPQNLPPDLFDAVRQIRFLKFSNYYDEYVNNKAPAVTFAISAGKGHDFCVSATLDEGIDVPHQICSDAARMMNATLSITISPWIKKGEAQIFQLQGSQKQAIQSEHETFFAAPVATLADAKSYLDGERNQLAAMKTAHLKSLIQHIESGSINFLPVYGYPIQKIQHEVETPGYLGNIFGIIAGARYAQLHGPQFDKPLVLAVFYNYSAERYDIQQMMIGVYEDPAHQKGVQAIQHAINQLSLTDDFSSASIEEAGISERLQSLKSREMLLIETGSLPKTVFDGLFTHQANNIWPAIREGQMSLNNLLLTGKPHLRCGGPWELDVVGYGPTQPKLQKTFAQFYGIKTASHYQSGLFCSEYEGWEKEALPEMVGQFMQEAFNPSSEMAAYFKSLKQFALTPELNRLDFSFNVALHLLNPNACEVEKKASAAIQPSYSTSGVAVDALLTMGMFAVSVWRYYAHPKSIKSNESKKRYLKEQSIFYFKKQITADLSQLNDDYDDLINQRGVPNSEKNLLRRWIDECFDDVEELQSGKTTVSDLNNLIYKKRFIQNEFLKLDHANHRSEKSAARRKGGT